MNLNLMGSLYDGHEGNDLFEPAYSAFDDPPFQ